MRELAAGILRIRESARQTPGTRVLEGGVWRAGGGSAVFEAGVLGAFDDDQFAAVNAGKDFGHAGGADADFDGTELGSLVFAEDEDCDAVVDGHEGEGHQVRS